MVETLLLLPLVLEVLFGSSFSNLVPDALFRSAIILLRKMAGCFTLDKSWLSVSILNGVMCRSAVCYCEMSWSYSHLESICLLAIQMATCL